MGVILNVVVLMLSMLYVTQSWLQMASVRRMPYSTGWRPGVENAFFRSKLFSSRQASSQSIFADELRILEQTLFRDGGGSAFMSDDKMAADIEKYVGNVEAAWYGAERDVTPMEWAFGTYDCCFHRIYRKGNESLAAPEYTTLSAVSFNQFSKVDPHTDDPIRCLSMFQCMDGNGRYDNLLTFFALDSEGDPVPGKYGILTRGKWATTDTEPFRLQVHFNEVSLREVPTDLHGAYATFSYLDETDTPNLIRNEQIDFLSKLNKTVHYREGGIDSNSESQAEWGPTIVEEVSEGKSLWSEDHLQDDNAFYASGPSAQYDPQNDWVTWTEANERCAILAPSPPLTMPINVSAHSDISFMDEEGMRIMRGCRGGLYVLIRSEEV